MEDKCTFCNLSYTEKKVLEYIKDGLTNEEIAKKMYISHNTVAKHISELLQRTELKNRIQLAVAYQKFITETE